METYTSIETIIDKILRDLGNKVTFSPDWYDWIMEAIQDLSVTQNQITKTANLCITNTYAPLPCYCITVTAVYHNGKPLPYIRTKGINILSPCVYYFIEGGLIHCNQDIELSITYLSYLLDDRGLPMIPDNHLYHEAVTMYVLQKLIVLGFQHPVFDYPTVKKLFEEAKRKTKGYFILPSVQEHLTNQNLSNRLVQSSLPNYNPETLNVLPYKRS